MMETSKVDYAGRTVNRNGDEIVFEGIRDPTKAICSFVLIYSFVVILSAGIFLLFIPCTIAFIYCIEFRNRRLYITHNELYGCAYELHSLTST